MAFGTGGGDNQWAGSGGCAHHHIGKCPGPHMGGDPISGDTGQERDEMAISAQIGRAAHGIILSGDLLTGHGDGPTDEQADCIWKTREGGGGGARPIP